MYPSTPTSPSTVKRMNSGFSRERQKVNSPKEDAIPFPPLNFIVTGKMCPMMTNKPQKYRVKSETTTFVPAKQKLRQMK